MKVNRSFSYYSFLHYFYAADSLNASIGFILALAYTGEIRKKAGRYLDFFINYWFKLSANARLQRLLEKGKLASSLMAQQRGLFHLALECLHDLL